MEEYIKDQDILELNEDERNHQLLQSIFNAQQELRQSHLNFETAEDELVDYYTYQIKANQAKLDYLTRLAKNLNLEF